MKIIRKHRPQGLAVIVVLALLAIILLYVTANIRTLNHLKRDLKIIEQKQVQRLQPPSSAQTPATNTPAAATAARDP